ncbi:MAG: cytochrome c-type biogenesis protein [Pseudomonadota bacterium]
MMRPILRTLLILQVAVFSLQGLPAAAVEPDEILADPALEDRARALSKEIRCLVCQNESIEDSRADLAKDLRILVRERLTAGDTDAEVMTYLTDRYGDFILLRPRFAGATIALWLAGPVVLLLGALAAFGFLRNRSQPEAPPQLSDAEKRRLNELTDT